MDNKDIIKNIATNLKKLRQKNDLSQQELVERIGEEKISLRSYKTYENENSTIVPLFEKIAIIADYYKCSIDYIVYNKDSIYTDSFSKKDNLKRLVDLIYSMVLIPEKEENRNSKIYGKYYFVSFDHEVNLLMDKLFYLSKEKNYKHDYEGIKDLNMLKHYHKEIDEISNPDESWEPTINRLRQIVLESGDDFDGYIKNQTEKTLKRIIVNSIKK